MLCARLNAFVVCVYMVYLSAENSLKAYKMCKRVKPAPGIRRSAETAVPTPLLKCNGQLAMMIKTDKLEHSVFLGSLHHVLFLICLDVFSLCCAHISLKLHQSTLAQQGSDGSVHTNRTITSHNQILF